MHTQAQNVGVTNELITITGSTGHVSYFGSIAGTDTILSHSIDFLFPLVCSNFSGQAELQTNALAIEMYPNTTSGTININNDSQ
jgi:hypothetical protein